MDSDRQKIYEQDCQFVRYHDRLMWSRAQTASALEGGMLYGLYVVRPTPSESALLAVLGTIFVILA